MSDPLKTIPPLIPLPSDTLLAGSSTNVNHDPFSVLTAPPPQSPTSASRPRPPVFSANVTSDPVRVVRPTNHGRNMSVSSVGSDFGSFVSSEHPLQGVLSEEFEESGHEEVFSTSPPSTSFFDKFTEEAKQKTKNNENRVLNDLRVHEHDPLSWLGSLDEKESKSTANLLEQSLSNSSTRVSTPTPLSSALREAGSTLIDLSTPPTEPPPQSSTLPDTSNADSTPPEDSQLHNGFRSVPQDTILHQQRSRTSPPPTSRGSGGTYSRSWMTHLLSSSRAVPARASSPASSSAIFTKRPSEEEATIDDDQSQMEGSSGLSPTQSHLQALFTKARISPPHSPTSHSASLPAHRIHGRYATDGVLSSFSTTSSPFASHIFIPPSGAPGFTGDKNWNTEGFEYDANHISKKLRLSGRKEMTTPVLDIALANSLRPHLPALARLPNTWTLLYSLDQHGISLNTLYSRCEIPPGGKAPGSSGALMVVQDSDGDVFGAWISEGIHLSHGVHYGGGDSFLWKSDPTSSDGVKLFKWTGRNDYVAYCDPGFVSFGGGDGYYGLYIDASLIEGTTHPCPTFNNETLAKGEKKGKTIAFECVGLEVWGVGP